jgi:hypothetical protein
MSSPSSLRSRWNAGCLLLFLSTAALWYPFKLLQIVIGWLVHEPAAKISPHAVRLLELAAMVLVGPFILTAFLKLRCYGLKRTLAQIYIFWLNGLRVGVFCLLVTLPYLFTEGALESDGKGPDGC